MTTPNPLLASALWYASHQLHVFPLKPRTKEPITAHGVNDATTDPAQVETWWRRWPDANIGLACGPSGLTAIDVDEPKGGADTWARLRAQLGLDDQTLTQLTANGYHLIYRTPPGVTIGNSVGKLGPGLDIRTAGGYIVVAPSIHPTGVHYRWEEGYKPSQRTPLPLPPPLIQLLNAPATNGHYQGDDETVPEGGRNAYLTQLGGAMRRRGMTRDEIAIALGGVNFNRCKPPLPDEEVERIATSVARYAPDDPVLRRIQTTPDAAPEEAPAPVLSPAPPLGWVDACADLFTRLSGAPPDFNRLCALVTLATAVQHRGVLRMSFGDIRPNIYAVIVAMSTIYHKSAALRLIRRLLRRAGLDELLLSELMTSEGLLKQLENQPAGVIIRDEIGTLFGSDRIKYLAQLKQDLTALYDGDPYSRQLSHEKVTVQSPYLNIIGATTPARFYESVGFNDWHDGFLARWLFVLAPEGKPSIKVGAGLMTTGDDAGLGDLADRITWIARQQATDFAIDTDAYRHWERWFETTVGAAADLGDDVLAALTGRYTTYALKFAVLLAAVNGTWGQITDAEMTAAIQLAEHYLAGVQRLREEKQDYGVSGAKLQKVFALIVSNPGIATKQIQQYAKMRASEVAPVLEKLVEIGAVTSEKSGRGWRYTATSDTLPIRTW